MSGKTVNEDITKYIITLDVKTEYHRILHDKGVSTQRSCNTPITTTLYTNKDDMGEDIVWIGTSNIAIIAGQSSYPSEFRDLANHCEQVAQMMEKLGRVVQ